VKGTCRGFHHHRPRSTGPVTTPIQGFYEKGGKGKGYKEKEKRKKKKKKLPQSSLHLERRSSRLFVQSCGLIGKRKEGREREKKKKGKRKKRKGTITTRYLRHQLPDTSNTFAVSGSRGK